jgi:hypothetical protein
MGELSDMRRVIDQLKLAYRRTKEAIHVSTRSAQEAKELSEETIRRAMVREQWDRVNQVGRGDVGGQGEGYNDLRRP